PSAAPTPRSPSTSKPRPSRAPMAAPSISISTPAASRSCSKASTILPERSSPTRPSPHSRARWPQTGPGSSLFQPPSVPTGGGFSCLLTPNKAPSMVQRVSTGSPFEATFGYSRAVRHEDSVYVSGTTGYDYATMTMPDDVGQQAANALATIDKALREAGSSLQDIVRVVYYVGDRDDVDAVVKAVGPVFKDIRPAASMLIVQM